MEVSSGRVMVKWKRCKGGRARLRKEGAGRYRAGEGGGMKSGGEREGRGDTGRARERKSVG